MNRSSKAYAKVNLHLEVLNRRDDGFHNIFSLMAHLDLYDLLKLEKAEFISSKTGKLSVEIVNQGGSCANVLDFVNVEDNLITKGVQALAQAWGYSGEMIFSLEKNIPAGGGLGGGSSDAAAAMFLMAKELGRSKEEIIPHAAAIGADVPFNLYEGFCLCEGIGEIIEPVTGTLGCTVLVVNNNIHVDTALAYKSLKRGADFGNYGDFAAMQKSLEEKKRLFHSSLKRKKLDDLKAVFSNDFERAVFELYPEVGELKGKVKETGSDFTIMTGSGSTIIGLFNDKERAVQACETLKHEVARCYIAQFVS